MSRPLTLHLSALSDDEYTLYTSSLSEISTPPPSNDGNDSWWEDRIVSLREARGWMRGRYGVDGVVIDKILRNFSPTLGPADTLSAGQFFAAMRLVLYAQRGTEPDRSLVFVQPPALPSTSAPVPAAPAPTTLLPPPRPPSGPLSAPVTDSQLQQRASPPPVPQSANPFQRSTSTSRPAAPETITLRPPPKKPSPDPFASPPPIQTGNPFHRTSTSAALPTPATSPTPSHFPLPAISPPLPPRKPAFLPPPTRHTSTPATAMGTLPRNLPPPPPPKPASLASSSTSGAPHLTSDLINRSLSVARSVGVQRRAENELAGARMLEVIRSSSTSPNSTGMGVGSVGMSAGTQVFAKARSPRPSPPASTIFSTSTNASEASLERIATTRFPSRSPSPKRPPPLLRSATTLPSRSEPTSGESSPISASPVPRTIRSKSVHDPSGKPPPPIPKRPRPESLQLGFSPSSPSPATHPAGAVVGSPMYSAGGTLKRSVSAAHPHGHRSSNSVQGTEVLASLRESFGALGLQARRGMGKVEQRLGGMGGRARGEGESLVGRDDTGGGGDSDSGIGSEDEERARRGWRPLET
ncbi:hypothetical protein EXIGLDRAFT_845682 [Exidia glandulosa HHB12029]|uniref:EH domain-containing protein n=1 Tax=Exidia glandulosa HHB12029 TaxID=1314781 RepID=A0A165BC32_EXIGL|nr:hypothetical protein EXIGLDRAFT_845682 [Exidia glandulosa HHB12029]